MFKEEMNVLGVSVLQDIRKIKGFEESIVAGGFVRDHIMGGQFTDIDIFIPYKDERKFHKNLFNLQNSPFTNAKFKPFNDYKQSINVAKFDCQYMGIETDLMGILYDQKESEFKTFGEYVTSTFSYGIDMAWYDGEIKTNKSFDYDHKNRIATLSCLSNIEMLPAALRKYERLISKYPGKNIRFRSSILAVATDHQVKNESREAINRSVKEEINHVREMLGIVNEGG